MTMTEYRVTVTDIDGNQWVRVYIDCDRQWAIANLIDLVTSDGTEIDPAATRVDVLS